jgi:hypothetical protein
LFLYEHGEEHKSPRIEICPPHFRYWILDI